jgi:hypothetical protein
MVETFVEEGDGEEATGGEKGLRPSRAIGGSLNALVRATILYRKGVQKFAIGAESDASENQRAVAERSARAWRRVRASALDVEATRLHVGGDLALQADNDHAQWVLFAFMAGVRRIQPRRAMTTEDLIRFTQALVALEPTVDSIEQFRDWLDADGAQGFDVRIHTSFREVFEEIDLEEEREFRHEFAMARFEAPSTGDAVWVAARDLDVVSMRKEFEVPIETYQSAVGVGGGSGGMSDDELAAIGKRCDDPNAWTSAELEAVLALPELRTAMTPEHMARRVVTRLSEEADERFLLLLARMNTKNDPFQQAVARALGTSEVGEIIARQLHLEGDEAVEALGKFLVLSPAPLATAVVGGILDRAIDDTSAYRAACLLSEWYGSAQICEWVLAPNLAREAARVLGAALAHTSATPADVTRIVGAAPIESALALLRVLPPETLRDLGKPLRFLWGRAKANVVEQVAVLMVRGGSPDNLKMLAELFVTGKTDRWKGQTLYALCGALVDHGFGRSHVLPVAMNRGASEGVRLIAIDCLARNAELADEATRFRMSALFESSEVRARFRKLAENRGGRP